MNLRKTRRDLDLSPMDIKRAIGLSVTILLDLEQSHPLVRANKVYQSYQEMLEQFYRDIQKDPRAGLLTGHPQ